MSVAPLAFDGRQPLAPLHVRSEGREFLGEAGGERGDRLDLRLRAGGHARDDARALPEREVGELAAQQQGVDGDPLEDWEITSFCVLLLLAGNETTRNLITCLLNVAADRPDLWEALRDDRSLIAPAIEESLRFNTSAQRFKRTVMRETELHGQRMRVGDKVALAFGSGNREDRKSVV